MDVIGVVIPAHDEEQLIAACLTSLNVAAKWPGLRGEKVCLVVALDACSDATERLARQHGALVTSVEARNVGMARSAGASMALDMGARWLAFTDADTEVAPDWLMAQLSLKADAVCGTVAVRDWGAYGLPMQRHFEATYTDADGHRHIHGANLAVSASAYVAAGGFEPLHSSEDVALVRALERDGANIAWSATPRVWTSARRAYRAPSGFGAAIERVGLSLCQDPAHPSVAP